VGLALPPPPPTPPPAPDDGEGSEEEVGVLEPNGFEREDKEEGVIVRVA